MQENHKVLEDSQARLSQDILNSSFSDLEDQDDIHNLEHTTHIDISEERTNSCENLIKQELNENPSPRMQPEALPICTGKLQKNNGHLSHLSESVLKKEEQILQKKSQGLPGKQRDIIEAQHIERIRVIYSRSFLSSQKISLSQIKQLKSFLFIPKHGEELVRWGNQKFGTNHTVVSALQRLQYLQDSECSELTVKLKQNLKYLLLICVCLVTIKVFV